MLASYNFAYKNETPTKWAGDHEKLLYRRVKKCLYQLANRREKIGQWITQMYNGNGGWESPALGENVEEC